MKLASTSGLLTGRIVYIFAAATLLVTSIAISISSRGTKASLTENLAGRWSVVSAEFDRRVNASFPVGSSEQTMWAELQRQGLTRDDRAIPAEFDHQAVRREDDFVCRKTARIYWRGDNGGRVIAIMGRYQEEGCL